MWLNFNLVIQIWSKLQSATNLLPLPLVISVLSGFLLPSFMATCCMYFELAHSKFSSLICSSCTAMLDYAEKLMNKFFRN
jgi:hypothetical protein